MAPKAKKEIHFAPGTQNPILIFREADDLPILGRNYVYVDPESAEFFAVPRTAGFELTPFPAPAVSLRPLYRVISVPTVGFGRAACPACPAGQGDSMLLVNCGNFGRAQRVTISSSTHLPPRFSEFIKSSFQGTILRAGVQLELPLAGNNVQLTVESVIPACGGEVSANTLVETLVSAPSSAPATDPVPALATFSKLYTTTDPRLLRVGEQTIRMLCACRPPPSTLLSGAPGAGKTYLVRQVAAATNVEVTVVSAEDTSDASLRAIFARLNRPGRAIIFFDELDALFPAATPVGRRSAALLLSLLRSRVSSACIWIVGATNRPEDVAPSLRAAGAFDEDIEVCAPSDSTRAAVLAKALSGLTSLHEEQISSFTSSLSGYSPADLVSLARRAVLSSHPAPVTSATLATAAAATPPSALRATAAAVAPDSSLTFETSIGGLQATKDALRRAADPSSRLPGEPGLLLYGPPGCSKTLLARVLAAECGLPFLQLAGADIITSLVGESEAALRRVGAQARALAPSVLFIDEIDALAPRRSGNTSDSAERTVVSLLSEIDSCVQAGVLLVAATNRPRDLDPALLRGGRFEQRILVPLPDFDARSAIFDIALRGVAVDESVTAGKGQLVKVTEGYTGAEIVAIARAAGTAALAAGAKSVSLSNLVQAVQKVRPRVLPEMMQDFEEFGRQG